MRAVLVAAVVVLAVGDISLALKLGTWNIRQFGKATMNRPGVPDAIAWVISQYDLIVIQEVQDSDGISITAIRDKLNQHGPQFEYRLSTQRQRQSRNLERYAVFFKPSTIGIEAEDTLKANDGFTYPPYKLVLKAAIGQHQLIFGMIVLHTSPSYAKQEMDNVAEKSRDFLNFIKTTYSPDTGVLIAGDLNAGSQLVLQNNRLTHKDFKWLIKDNMNTYIHDHASQDNAIAHDRLILLGTGNFKGIFNQASVHCYNNNQAFDDIVRMNQPGPAAPGSCVPPLDSYRMMRLISDHYPVTVQMN